MNKNKIVGFALIVAALALIVVCASLNGASSVNCLGKAVWYLPYAALVGGIGRLVRA